MKCSRGFRTSGCRITCWTLVLSAALGLMGGTAGRACDTNPGAGPFTVVGWINRPDGRPVPGLSVVLVPLATPSGRAVSGEPDLENGIFRIEERDDHLTRTNDQGLFVMPKVYDYPEVFTHQYQVVPAALAGLRASAGEDACWLDDAILDLTDLEAGMVKLHLTARPAGAVKVRLTDQSGAPFTGPRAVLILGAGPTLAVTAQFENGAFLLGPLPAGRLQLGLLDGELGYFVQQRAAHEQRPLTDYLLSSRGGPLVPVSVEPGAVTPVELILP